MMNTSINTSAMGPISDLIFPPGTVEPHPTQHQTTQLLHHKPHMSSQLKGNLTSYKLKAALDRDISGGFGEPLGGSTERSYLAPGEQLKNSNRKTLSKDRTRPSANSFLPKEQQRFHSNLAGFEK